MAEQSIGRRTLRGILWAYSSYVGGRLLVLVSTAILARVLTPREFGIVALALLAMTFFETVKDFGLTQALVAAPDERVLERAETVFVSSIAVGAALSALVAAVSPLAAAFFDEPQLLQIIPVLGLNFLVRSLGSTHYALAQKRLDFRARTVAELADAVVRGLTGIALALAGAGVWSLVIGYVVGTAVLAGSLWLLVPWRPALRPKREHLPSLLRFGGPLTGVDALSAVTANADYLFVGKVLGAATLGLYTLAFRLPELIVVNLSTVAGQVLFPAFTHVDRTALADAYLVAFRYMLMLSLPLTAAMVIMAEPLVAALFGPQWSGAVAPMQVLALYALAVTVGIPAGTAYKAIGRADVLLKLALPRTALLIGAVAVFVDDGIVAVAGCQAAVAALFSVVGLLLASRLLRVRLRRLVAAMAPTLIATAGMAVALALVSEGVAALWATLIVAAVAGAAVYLGLLWLVARDAVLELLARLRGAQPVASDLAVSRETDVIA